MKGFYGSKRYVTGAHRCTVVSVIETAQPMTFRVITISYVYAVSDVWKKYETAIEIAGWRKSVILTQIAQTFGKVNADYYFQCAEADAIARGFERHQGRHYELLADGKDMPAYTSSRPLFEPSPLAAIPDPDSSLPRQSFGQFRCSNRNAAIIRMALIVDRSNINVLMSKMMSWYYDRYWDLYKPQLMAAEQKTIKPEL